MLALRIRELTVTTELNQSSIARRLHCSSALVHFYQRRFGLLRPRGRRLHDVNAQRYGFADAVAAARAWAEAGLTNGEIGDRLGCWGSRASLYVHAAGPVQRPAGRGRVLRRRG